MKRILKTVSFLLVIAGLAALSSCDSPIALGQQIFMDGPRVQIETPKARQPIDGKFELSGDINSDNKIDRVEIKIRYTKETYEGSGVFNDSDLGKQWRKSGSYWEVKENGGSWSRVQPLMIKNENGEYVEVKPVWNGSDKSATWTVPINMDLNGSIDEIPDGQYIVTVTAWDKAGNSDDNSSQTRMVFLYKYPPSVNIVLPKIYPEGHLLDENTELGKQYRQYLKDDYKVPEFLGKFISGKFDLQFQIVERNDVWSVDIRFYKENVDYINAPDDYVYRTYINDALNMTPISDPNYYDSLLSPNYRVTVPDLSGQIFAPKTDGERIHELKESISGKNILRAVARCTNAAGIPLPDDERMQGCFIYWPESDLPWVEFSRELETIKVYDTDNIYATFATTPVPVKAYDDDGVARVVYTIYTIDGNGTVVAPLEKYKDKESEVPETEPKIFSWNFELQDEDKTPLPPGDYYIKAAVFDKYGVKGEDKGGWFKVKDINFPDITPPITPDSEVPLFRYITGSSIADWKITIEGHATDNRSIKEVKMVWINPRYENYAAMSQLNFYRDSGYIGWDAPPKPSDLNGPGIDYSFVPTDPNLSANERERMANRVYTLEVVVDGNDPDTGRPQFKYSITDLPLKDLYIQPGTDPYGYLKSQVFVFKAVNDDNPAKTSIITWSPQGDTEAPVIKITGVNIRRGITSQDLRFHPEKEDPIEQFSSGDVITVTGEWVEDSTGYLNIQNVLTKNLSVNINGKYLTGDAGTNTTKSVPGSIATSGTWTVSGTVSNSVSSALTEGNLKDTLVVTAELTDVGGNSSEDVASWLIASDTLQLLRVGSDTPNGIYKAGDSIDIFLEFNMPVTLKSDRSANPGLRLALDNSIIADAVYNSGQNTPNSKQHFTYTVGPNHNKNDIDVTGLSVNDSNFTSSTYPFTWVNTSGGNDGEIRLVISNRTLPNNAEYRLGRIYVASDPIAYSPFTLKGGSSISVDTVGPTLTDITPNIRAGWYNVNSPLYFTATFNEPIQEGANLPKLVMNIENGGTATTRTAGVQINGNQAIFSYTVVAGDFTTSYGDLRITGIEGDITDHAGNPFVKTPFTARTFAGIRVDSIVPSAPTLLVRNAGVVLPTNVVGTSGGVGVNPWIPESYASSENFNGETGTGYSGDIERLGNVYFDNLYIHITPAGTGGENHTKIEYSVNYGKDWVQYDYSGTNLPKERLNQGRYDLTARQIDAAGNVSQWSKPITLNWDKGALLTRITTDATNGIYTRNANRTDTIPIKLVFRVPVTFTTSPTLTLNARDSTTPTDIVTLTLPNSALNTSALEHIFYYTVRENDTTDGLPLTVVLGGTFSAQDSKGTVVTSMVNMTRVIERDQRFQDLKEIYIQTGKPEFISWDFIGNPSSDDTFNSTLNIKFDRSIYRGSATINSNPNVITAIQSAAGYRLPAILTESQQTLFKTLLSAKGWNIDNYYTKGTSGYINGTGPDTTAKYILKFEYDTYNIVPSDSGTATNIQRFAEAFRQAESITLPINSSAISINDDTISISLQGSNALKVLGATYEISYPAGFIVDILSNPCVARAEDETLDGVSRPSIRIYKPEDTIDLAAIPSDTTPRFIATQPGQAQIRMDCRTPNSRVRYISTQREDNDASVHWGSNLGPGGSGAYKGPIGGDPDRPGDPRNATNYFGNTTTASVSSLPIGSAASNDDYQYSGFKYRIRAVGVASDGTMRGTNDVNAEAEEIAYRTVIVFEANNITATNGQTFGNGDQLWIRGGNTLTATTIPGFPLTPEDDWSVLSAQGNNSRAGIRLMTKLGTGTLNNSVWQWVTWNVNSKVYFDLYLGRDNTSTAATVFKYGPKQFAVHIGNWTNMREYSAAFPGERRMLASNLPNFYSSGSARQYAYTFNGAFSERPTY